MSDMKTLQHIHSNTDTDYEHINKIRRYRDKLKRPKFIKNLEIHSIRYI